MKELRKAIKCVLISQFGCWGLFILCDENKLLSQTLSEEIALICGIISLIVLLIIYYKFSNKFISKNNMEPKKFNIFLLVLWVIVSVLIMTVLINLVNNNYLHVCEGTGWGCLLNGIEYGFQGVLMVILAILIIIINTIIKYKHIKK